MEHLDAKGRERLSERECQTVFARLFPLGLGGDDVLAQIAPMGWERSPLLAVFHPSVEQVYREALRIHRNIEALAGTRRPLGEKRDEPTIEEIRATWQDQPVERDREARELVGRCLWDVFSDNNDVIGPDGRVVDIGSFRGAGDFIAELLNRECGESRYDYMDFYLGSIWVSQRADLTPVYAMIFSRLARHGFDWEYTFPRLYAVEFGEPEEASTGVAERLERERERAELRESMEQGHRDALERAKDEPPPPTVQAYRQVYGCDPAGWPPWD
jgi:hypothetical protein